MKILIFGATGMVGQGAMRECLLADDVTLVQTVGRTATGQQTGRFLAQGMLQRLNCIFRYAAGDTYGRDDTPAGQVGKRASGHGV